MKKKPSHPNENPVSNDDKSIPAEKKSGSTCSRRGFLEQTGVAVAGAALANQPLFAEPASPKKVRIGVVGGGFGCSFQWHEHPNCVVQAVSDLRPERRQRLKDVYHCDTAYDSLEELVLAKDIDAVAIFTDGPLHVQHVVETMKNGKHAISAVPAAYGSLEQADLLFETVQKHGLTYMMAETSYYQQFTISARKFQEAGKYGEIFYCESEYQHDGLQSLYLEDGKRTWRYGMAPMHYPTHCTAHLVSVTGERLTEVVCHGWGDGDPILQDNAYNNPFWNESAMFKTDKGHGFRVNVFWKGAHRGCERAQWIGNKMSFYAEHPNGMGPVIVREGNQTETDDAGFVRNLPNFEPYEQVEWWKTDMLPEALRHNTGHHGSHAFLTNEFILALIEERKPKVDVHEALAYTVPGIVAHQSALAGGELKKIPSYDRA